MATYGNRIKVTRSNSSVGPVLIVHIPGVSRVAQVYSLENSTGMVEFFGWVTTILGPGVQPSVERVPDRGGCATIEDLEQLLAIGGR